MYTQDIKPLTFEAIREGLQKQFDYLKKNRRHTIKNVDMAGDLDSAARSLLGLNAAMVAGRSVWAVCVKSPRGNLDTGRHYYEIWYVDESGRRSIVWSYSLGPLVGMDENNRDRQIGKWLFSSGAIGMSRLLDATDSLFCFLRNIGGGYAQIDL